MLSSKFLFFMQNTRCCETIFHKDDLQYGCKTRWQNVQDGTFIGKQNVDGQTSAEERKAFDGVMTDSSRILIGATNYALQ